MSSPLYWAVAVDTEDAYAEALLGGNGSPGYDETVISDDDITTAITAHWPADPATTPSGGAMNDDDIQIDPARMLAIVREENPLVYELARRRAVIERQARRSSLSFMPPPSTAT